MSESHESFKSYRVSEKDKEEKDYLLHSKPAGNCHKSLPISSAGRMLKLLLLLKMHIDHPTASLQVSFYLTWYNSSAMTVHSHGTYSWQLTSSPDLSSQSLHLKQSNYWRVTLNVEKETNTFLSDLTVWRIFSIVRKCQLQICWRRWYNLIQSPTLRI